ncbi:hypothetical protein PIROE2DRAFT_59606, partial [Piromyces sp. E2]
NNTEPVSTNNTITKEGVICDEPKTEAKLTNESDTTPSKPAKNDTTTTKTSNSLFNSENSEPAYRPYYAPQAPPGGKSSISFGNEDEPVPAPKQKQRPNPEFQESMFSATGTTPYTGRRISNQNKQNNQSTFSSSIFGSSSSENDQPYKPYYAPQAPPGGKDSISLGSSEPDNSTQTSFSGRRRNYNRDHFKSSINFNY